MCQRVIHIGGDRVALDKRQMKAMDLLLSGETITNTAKIVGVERKTIYRWKDREDWKVEWDERIQEIKTEGNNRITNNLDKYVTELEKIAMTGRSEKNRVDALQYLIIRSLCTPTSKVQDISNDENKDNKVDTKQVAEEFKKFKMVK